MMEFMLTMIDRILKMISYNDGSKNDGSHTARAWQHQTETFAWLKDHGHPSDVSGE